ncbi:MAG: hypothetical protein V4556_13170 [Bacteroidota bacterium]
METKYNEATLNRPDGDRIIDAPFVFIDLKKYARQLKDEIGFKKNDRNSITVYKTDGLTMVLTLMHNGAMIKDNIVEGLMTIQVIDGTIDCQLDINTIRLTEQQVITIHPGIIHSIQALGNSLLLITNRSEK